MIYLDSVGHLTSDGTLDELHGFAQQIGLKREWFQEGRHPHYDILSLRINRLARRFGAQEATDRDSERVSRELGERSKLPTATYLKGETGYICEARWGPGQE